MENKFIVSKASWTPYDGLKFQGWPIITIVNGKVAMRENQIIGDREGKKILFS